MSDLASIALACPQAAERASVVEWLSQSGYNPVAVSDLSHLDEELQFNPIEALVADAALVPRDDLPGLLRRLGLNRPLVLLGDPRRLPPSMMGDLSVVARPLTRDALLLSVGLALAEGRPARRFARRRVERITASAHGQSVTVHEVSPGGVGFEMPGARPNLLPPFFGLLIPEFGIHVLVKRAWLAPAGPGSMRCGGTIEGDMPGSSQKWVDFVREAPAPVSAPSVLRQRA
jgi:hypothetical protein